MPRIALASRGSRLALTQARLAEDALRRAVPSLDLTLAEVRTEGDERPEPLTEIGGKGIFVKEVDDRVLEGSADLAVHSCKDMPTGLHAELTIAALLERGPAHDVLVGPFALAALPRGARLGTSSPRRGAQLRRFREDLRIVPLRGNVPTRLDKVGSACDATVLAAAGLERLGLQNREGLHPLTLREFPTAPGQGAIAIVARKGSPAAELAARADHGPTRVAVEAERAVLREVGTGCAVPLGCSAWWDGDSLEIVAQLLAPDGSSTVGIARRIDPARHAEEARELGLELARRGRATLG